METQCFISLLQHGDWEKKDEALWQLEELMLINSPENLDFYLQKQPWDKKIKDTILTTFSEILENR